MKHAYSYSNAADPAACCAGKVRFDTFAMASRINRERNKGRSDRGRCVYACLHCKGFHIGQRTRRLVVAAV